MTRRQAIEEVCGPGKPLELKTTQIGGKNLKVFVNAPATLRDLYQTHASDLDFLVYKEERLSYAEVHKQATSLGMALGRLFDVQHGDRVVIAMRNYPEWVIAFFAVTSIGAIAVPVNAWWNARELEHSLIDCNPKVAIVDEERLLRLFEIDSLSPDLQIISTRTDTKVNQEYYGWENVVGFDLNNSPPDIIFEPDDDAIILYTSGSTGLPKGVVSSHRAIIHALLSWELDWELRDAMGVYTLEPSEQQGAMLLAVPLFHVSGCHAAMLSSIRMQRKLICMYKWDVEEALRLIELERITAVMATPAISGDILHASKTSDYDLSTLVVLGGGGAPRAPDQVIAINEMTDNVVPATGWGMTETNAIGAGVAADDYLRYPESSGQCSGVLDMRIVGDDGTECLAGERGELQVRGTSMFRGYWNRPDATNSARDGEWFRTGDVATLNDEGFLFIVDRIKDLVIRGGENIGCGAVEFALSDHPEILEACVYGIPDERLGEEVGATLFVTKILNEEELRGFLVKRLSHFEIPRYINQQMSTLPRIASGKIAKRQIRAQAVSQMGIVEKRS